MKDDHIEKPKAEQQNDELTGMMGLDMSNLAVNYFGEQQKKRNTYMPPVRRRPGLSCAERLRSACCVVSSALAAGRTART